MDAHVMQLNVAGQTGDTLETALGSERRDGRNGAAALVEVSVRCDARTTLRELPTGVRNCELSELTRRNVVALCHLISVRRLERACQSHE